MPISVKRFDRSHDIEKWNKFISSAQNATFLFNRSFMDYHMDRFTDFSLMIYDEKDKLIACFPANQSAIDEVFSHQGLTYGGFIMKAELKLPVKMDIFTSVLRYYLEHQIRTIRYKAFPQFYNSLQTGEIEYCLFLGNAKLYRRDTTIAVDRNYRIPYSGNIRRESKKAQKAGIQIHEEKDFYNFWDNVLIPNLQQRFSVTPVHSKEEIMLLKNRFPENIRLFVAKDEKGKLFAGTVLFVTKNVVHCQYISATNLGRKNNGLNFLFTYLLDNSFQEKQFFDFGIVNENEGKKINYGLLAWKERMGGRSYSHDFYEINTKSYKDINNIFNGI